MNFYLIKHLNQNKMKQTAVEWLNKELYQLDTKVRSYKTIDYIKKRQSIIQQALELEKEQNQNEFERGFTKCADTLQNILNKGLK